MKIKVSPEGREDIYIPAKGSLIKFISNMVQDDIHCFVPSQVAMIGADWSKESVIDEIQNAERIGILLGNAAKNNLGHSIAAITNNKLRMFDVSITIDDLDIVN